MANKERSTWQLIWSHRPVILNFGLLPGLISKQPHMLPMQRSIAYMTVLKELMQPGFKAQLRMDQPEPTLVVSGTFSSLAVSSTLLWDTLILTGQDCIALFYPEDTYPNPCGFLFGPESDTWGEFDKAQFVMPMEFKHEA